MRYEGITVSNVGSYVLNWAIYATVLVGAYAAAFHLKTLRTLTRENGGNSMPDVVAFANALGAHPDAGLGLLIGGVAGAVFGALRRPTAPSTGDGGE